MPDILARIETYKRAEIATAKRTKSLASLEVAAKAAGTPRGFLDALPQPAVTRSLPRSSEQAPRRV
jgi:indole-3-glycerol phosphate synthase